MPELLAGSPDCDASDQVRTGTDLSELELTSKRRKTGEGSSENEGGLDGSRSNDDGRTAEAEWSAQWESLFSVEPSSENEGGLDGSRRNEDGRTAEAELSSPIVALCQPIRSPCQWELPFSVKPSSENEGRLDDSWSNGNGWMLDLVNSLPREYVASSSYVDSRLDDRWSNGDIEMTNKAGLLCPPPPHSLSLGTSDSQVSIQNWNKSESNGSLDREDNHDNRASSENEDRLLGCRSYDDLPLKLTLPVSSTEIGKESNEINGVEGSCGVHPVAGKCPVRHPNAGQLLSASSSNSDYLDVNLRMEGRPPPPLLLWSRDMFSQPYHHHPVGTIFGNLKPENVLTMTDRLFCGQLSYIKKNNMDPFLVKSTPEAEGLFLRLLKKNPELRLGEKEVLLHPFSWSLKDKLHFLHQMREMLASENLELDADLLEELESNEPPVFDGNWIDKLDPIFKDYILKRPENYDYSSVLGLVRCIRNNSIHLPRLPRKIKKKVGWNDADFYIYFAVRFPSLLMKLYGVASQFCREERWFKEFHEEIIRELFGRDVP
ncbi:hypothetical protein EUGRSUZ_L00876 [Eucalyptus grandis]|uniref:KEN domain-containing protein n=1 Tax=Eucalyptus grandis TaxID=71139 RepID=A0A058ZWQ6_EUCGR|nr:hypothetical protein EUGRSUZ_L00876 [Eucalyptus grandis]